MSDLTARAKFIEVTTTRDITLFYTWTEMTDKPIPPRNKGETNEEYSKRNWRALKRVAREFLTKHETQTT